MERAIGDKKTCPVVCNANRISGDMADDIQMDEPKVGETDGVASAPAEVEVTVGDAAREDDAVEVASIIDTVDGMPSGSDPRGESRVSGEDDVVDEVRLLFTSCFAAVGLLNPRNSIAIASSCTLGCAHDSAW